MISWRHGDWEYGGVWRKGSTGAVECKAMCDEDVKCVHWVFDCKSNHCAAYGMGGFEEDGSGQFGRDFMFLGESTDHVRRLQAGGAAGEL